jgi:transposase/IS1 family transposase
MNEVEELRLRVAQLEKENLELRKKLLEFEKRLAIYENANTPPSKQRFRKKQKEEGSGKLGRPKGAEGSTRPTPQPTETIDVTTDSCPKCKRLLGDPDFVETKIIEEIPEPQPVKVTGFKIAHYNCACGEHIVAKHPDCPETGRFGPRLQAEVAAMKFDERLPMKKICSSLMARYGLKLTPASILEILNRVRKKVEGKYESLKGRVYAAKNVNADETTYRVNGKDWYLWIFKTISDVVFLLRNSRGKKVVEEILKAKTSRTVGSDGYSVYSDFGTSQQRCWSHLIRQLKYAAEENEKFRPFLEELRKFYHELKLKVAKKPPPHIRKKIVLSSIEWLQYFIDAARSHPELRKFATYCQNGMNQWFTFVENDGIEPTNNSCEQLLREQIVIRKIIGQLRNEKGIGIYEVLASLIATWKLQGLNLRSQLVAALRS